MTDQTAHIVSAELIFVSIASYRDPQLVPTVLDLIAKAAHPERLRVGICWQRGPEEAELPFKDDPRLRIHEVSWDQSRGACWARAQVMHLWQGESWFMQADSHCRFAASWDELMITAASQTGSPKPILSTYATPFTPGDNEILREDPLQIAFQAFTPDGIPQLKPGPFPQGPKPQTPVPARFLSAGFLFAPGCFVEEVPYDPELYFMGEESSMTVRAYTHGYDLFHPSQTIVWHDYVRADARKHWGDHTEQTARPWGQLDEASRRKVQRLLRGESVGSFGVGTVRTLEDYEAYAGLSFKEKKAQQYTVEGNTPPNPAAPPDWTDRIYPWIVRARLLRTRLQPAAFEDPSLWYLGIQDERGVEICRVDLTPEQIAALDPEPPEIDLIAEFPSEAIPATWTVWPLSRSQGWLRKVGSALAPDDFAILKDDTSAEEHD